MNIVLKPTGGDNRTDLARLAIELINKDLDEGTIVDKVKFRHNNKYVFKRGVSIDFYREKYPILGL